MAKVTRLRTQTEEVDAGGGSKLPPTKVVIKEPNFASATVTIVGTSMYVQNRFSSENREKMMTKQKEGSSKSRGRRAKPPKDFKKVYEGSMHISQDGWHGIPASAIRNAMIDACRLTEFDMLRAKMTIWIKKDGVDRDSLEDLVRIIGKPRMLIERVRIGINQTDLVARAAFEGWSAKITVEWDADALQAQDIINLLVRAGRQVGIGAGRPLSKSSPGMGRGTWQVIP